ncbi:ligase [Brevibacillus sp. SYP-B805]|uniref:O-antigen ligase family protein n=1 Tax=Brevibacillus sp. SYP-B805 TaxID=1578199 RepID=UPI0013EABC28|nr:O-antigen ligase family protein [Brevibacillus sp. SYP-B805]NGQ94429.1 ligase [Brevibacillus sp. SYP-B805]
MGQTLRTWITRSDTWLYLLLGYPIIDYVMRKILPIPIVSSFWDDGLLLVLMLFTFGAYLKGTRKMPGIKQPFLAFLVLGLALIVTDMAHADAGVEGFRAIYQYMLAFFVGFYLIQSAGQLEKYVKLLAIVGFVVGLIGIAQVALGVQTSLAWVNAGEATRTRAYSIVTSPNVLGSYMALISPVSIGLFLHSTTKKDRLIWAVVALTSLAALVFTGSRGAWFALALVLFIGCLMWNRRVAACFLIAGLIGAVALYFAPHLPVIGTIKDRIATLFTREYLEKSLSDGRLARWFDAYDQLRLEPLFGAGPGHHGGAVAARHFGTIYTDSYLFKSIAELGLIGVGLLIALMVITLRYGYRLVRQMTGTPHFFLVLGLFCGLFAVILHNMVENIFEVPFMALYFWLFGGFLTGLLADQSHAKQSR